MSFLSGGPKRHLATGDDLRTFNSRGEGGVAERSLEIFTGTERGTIVGMFAYEQSFSRVTEDVVGNFTFTCSVRARNWLSKMDEALDDYGN